MIKIGEYEIREANESDIWQAIKINEKTLPEHYTFEFYLEVYRNFPEGFLIAWWNSNAVGYIMNRIERGLSHFGFSIVKQGHVVSIAVLPEHRRKGIGTALLQTAIEKMKNRGCQEVYLEVRVTNEEAIKVYEKLNFVKVRKIEYYYSDGEDAYVMARKL